ncbi:MAG: hypothetical protein Q9M32_06830 [Sulfurimonas sp.]|nr:hypothetical protein [Sulfurimonas sp.]MDQ7061475.1 hypothetical protein [Sulfurimonas sp.]
MNRTSFALFVALLIHFLFLLLYLRLETLSPEIKKNPKQEKKIKISLKDLPPVQKRKTTKQIEKKIDIAPPMPKGKQLKKIITKPKVVFKPKKVPKKPKLNPKPKPKVVKPKLPKTKALAAAKPFIPLIKEKAKEIPKQKKTSEMDWLTEDKSAQIRPQDEIRKSRGMSSGRNIQELYGNDFGKLSAGQQKYIIDNQEIMRRITQEVLNRQARVSNINGINANRSNVIEFYLHPNGDMSDFKFLKQSGYFILDDLTKSTIEFAYSRYPRPTEKTLIRYNVFYNLMHR